MLPSPAIWPYRSLRIVFIKSRKGKINNRPVIAICIAVPGLSTAPAKNNEDRDPKYAEICRIATIHFYQRLNFLPYGKSKESCEKSSPQKGSKEKTSSEESCSEEKSAQKSSEETGTEKGLEESSAKEKNSPQAERRVYEAAHREPGPG